MRPFNPSWPRRPQRSAEAAKEIKGLISASAEQVGRGVRLVGETGESLERILVQVGEITTVVSEIARGAKEQAVALAEVHRGWLPNSKTRN